MVEVKGTNTKVVTSTQRMSVYGNISNMVNSDSHTYLRGTKDVGSGAGDGIDGLYKQNMWFT